MDKTIKYTKHDKIMAILNLEDLVGNIEVIVFEREYERYSSVLSEDAKVFIKGRVSADEEKDAKLVGEQIVTFAEAAEKPAGKLFGKTSYGYARAQKNTPRQMPQKPKALSSQTVSKVPRGVWVQFADAQSYGAQEQKLLSVIADSDGNDNIVIYLKNTKALKVLPENLRVKADEELHAKLDEAFGAENIKFLLK